MHDQLQTLKQLRIHNSTEFRFQMNSLLKRMAYQKNEQVLENFKQIISSFKKEFIQDSFFYIDELNLILNNLLFKLNFPIKTLFNQILFLSQIGDTHTYYLLKKIIHIDQIPYINSILKEAEQELSDRLKKYEKYSENYKLYPMIEIADDWID